MIATNELLNRINDWNAPEQNAFKRHIGSRFTNLCVTAPIQTIAVAQNILIVPFQIVGITLNLAAKTISVLSCSDALKDFRANMPALSDLARTVARIFLYTIGTVITATVGVALPNANFKIQCALGLAINEREEALRLAFIEAEVEKLNELAAKNQIDNLVDVLVDNGENIVEVVQEGIEKVNVAVQEEVEKIVVENNQIVVPEENVDAPIVSTLVVDDENDVAEFTETATASENEVCLEANAVKISEDSEVEGNDVLIDFEGVEETAVTKAIQTVITKSSKVVNDSANYISGLMSRAVGSEK